MTCKVVAALAATLSVALAAPTTEAAVAEPTNVLATATTSTRIVVSWGYPASAPVTGFEVERSLKSASGFKIVATMDSDVRTYQDANLSSAITYYYRVRAVNSGNRSRRSPVTSATTLSQSSTLPTPVRTATPVRTRTSTPIRTATRTATPVRTSTRTPTATATPARTATRTATATVTATRTSIPVPTATPGAPAGPFAKRFGGAGSDMGQATAIDGQGNVVVTGLMNGSADFGGATLTSAGGADVVLAKYSSAGAHLWSKRIGHLWSDQGFGLAIDLSPNCDGAGGTNCIVVAGSFTSAVDFGSGTALESAGSTDIFLAKYSSAGAYLWAKRYGGINADYGYAVAVDVRPGCDGSGNANVSGCLLLTGSIVNGVVFDGVQLIGPLGVSTFFVEKLSPAGTRLWARTYVNTNLALGRAIAVDDAGDVAVTGSFQQSLDFGNGIKVAFGGDDIFVAKLRGSDGGGVWSNRYGADGVDKGLGVAFDAAGNVSVTGVFGFMSSAVSFGGQSWSANGTDIFVAQLNGANGTHRWSRRCSGTYTNVRQASGIATDLDGNVVITGHFYGSLNCGTDTPTLTGVGYSDVLTAKFSANGAAVWMKRFGSVGGVNLGRAIAIDPVDDQVVATGAIQGHVDVEGQSMQSAGAEDAFLVRFRP